MGTVCQPRETSREHFYGTEYIETEYGKVGEIIRAEWFTLQMGMYKPEPPEPVLTGPVATEFGYFYTPCITNEHVIDMTPPANKPTDLPPYLP